MLKQVRRRSRIDIICDILQRARRGAKKTQMVYGCNLNFKIFKQYAKDLRERGLLEERNGIVQTTLKGKRCLQWFREGMIEFGLQ